jgi:hypothetical protein
MKISEMFTYKIKLNTAIIFKKRSEYIVLNQKIIVLKILL